MSFSSPPETVSTVVSFSPTPEFATPLVSVASFDSVVSSALTYVTLQTHVKAHNVKAIILLYALINTLLFSVHYNKKAIWDKPYGN